MIRLPKFIQRIIDFLVGKKQRPLKKYNFLIVCTGNTCRSPMAQRIVECLKVVVNKCLLLNLEVRLLVVKQKQK